MDQLGQFESEKSPCFFSRPQVTLQLLILSICPLAPEELLGSKVFLAPDTLW